MGPSGFLCSCRMAEGQQTATADWAELARRHSIGEKQCSILQLSSAVQLQQLQQLLLHQHIAAVQCSILQLQWLTTVEKSSGAYCSSAVQCSSYSG